ncbi:MAG: hypothetical protein QOF48_3021 [Verrucomicrobiota bacterium]|jgi:hypothetical protein
MKSSPVQLADVRVLLRGEPGPIRDWMERWSLARFALCVAVIVAGTAAFGAALGSWRAPRQALYTAIKLPLILLLTTGGNGLLNAMLAPLFGLNLGARQSLLAVLLSFTIAAVILGGFSPVLWFLIWNVPLMSTDLRASFSSHSIILIVETLMIAIAGLAANLRLFQLLNQLSGSRGIARRVLFGWLAGNLLLGSQLAWILRPFVGSPVLEVEFLRPHAFEGNFYEIIWAALRQLFSS